MDKEKEDHEFIVLGQKIKWRSKPTDQKTSVDIPAQAVVDEVNKLAAEISRAHPQLGQNAQAVLVSLKLAQTKLSLEAEFRDQITEFEASTKEALQLIEEVSPTMM